MPGRAGFWINREVSRALNALDVELMCRGLAIAIISSRGVHILDPTGQAELNLAEKYSRRAKETDDADNLHLAKVFRNLSQHHILEAKKLCGE